MKKFIINVKELFLNNTKAAIGVSIVVLLCALSSGASLISSYEPNARIGMPHQAPSAEHVMGTTRMGRDVASQVLHGGRTSIMVGLVAGCFVMLMAVVMGVTAGYFGGTVDNVLSFLTNIVMVVPSLPLMLVLAAFLDQVSPLVIAIIIGATSWPWGARVIRAQTLSIRSRDFVNAAEVMGESKPRMVFFEVLPNMLSILASSFVGTVIYAIMTQATLEFIGFGDPLSNTWGVMLYNAQQTSAIRIGAWWEILAPSVALASLAIGLALINFSIDEISNPKLRAQKIMSKYRREQAKLAKAAKKVEKQAPLTNETVEPNNKGELA